MAITDYIPNVFGSAAPTTYEGLLGTGLISPEQMKQTQNTANIQGLLGAGLALAQGMSKIGPRRSAAENILGALAGGFGAAGGAYEQGVKNYMTQQQIAQTQLAQKQAKDRMASIEQIAKEDPALARLIMLDPSEGAKQYALKQQIKGFQPQGGTGEINTPEAYRALGQQYLAGGPNLKPLGEAYMKQADALELTSLGNLKGDESPEELDKRSTRAYALGSKDLAERLFGLAEQKRMYPDQVQAAPQAQDLAQREAMPVDQEKQLSATQVTEPRGRQGQLQLRIDNINRDIERISGMRPTAANRKEVKDLSDLKDKLQVDLNRLANMEYDFKSIKDGLPKKYHSEIDAVEKLAQAGTLDSAGIRSSVEKFYSRLQEDEKGRKLEGNAALFAQMKFGVTDRAQLNGQQLAEILRFEAAPNAEQLAKLQQTNRQLQFETGAGVALPTGKVNLIGGGTAIPAEIPPQPGVVNEPTTRVPAAVRVAPPATTTAAATNVQAATQPQSTQRLTAPENAPPQTKALYSYNKTALINQPDSKFPPKDKVKLRAEQPAASAAINYSLASIKDARDAANILLNNPKYLEALSSKGAEFWSQKVMGYTIDQDTYTANELLKNILGRSFVSEIQQMRQASPTGGAVGSVAVAEMEALSKIRAALSLGMDIQELKQQLTNYVSNADRSLGTIPQSYSKTYGYAGEFDDILTKQVVQPKPEGQKTPIQIELEKRKRGGK